MNEPNNDEKNEPKRRFWWILGFALVFLVGILPATLSRTYGVPYWVRCAHNLHGIGKCVILYQSEHDMLPPNLAALVAYGQPAEIFKCPSTDTEKATTQPADFTAHCDYIYAPNMEEEKELVMAFELPANHRQDVVNVLFNNFRVKTIQQEMDQFVSLIQELNDYHAGLRRTKP